MLNDAISISTNTGYDISTIQSIKEYLFVEIHDLGDGRISRFDPDFAIAQSWMRLVEGSDIKRHDLTLIRHEIMERDLMEDGFSQDDAHIITSQVYNYHKESDEYYNKDPKYQKYR